MLFFFSGIDFVNPQNGFVDPYLRTTVLGRLLTLTAEETPFTQHAYFKCFLYLSGKENLRKPVCSLLPKNPKIRC